MPAQRALHTLNLWEQELVIPPPVAPKYRTRATGSISDDVKYGDIAHEVSLAHTPAQTGQHSLQKHGQHAQHGAARAIGYHVQYTRVRQRQIKSFLYGVPQMPNFQHSGAPRDTLSLREWRHEQMAIKMRAC